MLLNRRSSCNCEGDHGHLSHLNPLQTITQLCKFPCSFLRRGNDDSIQIFEFVTDDVDFAAYLLAFIYKNIRLGFDSDRRLGNIPNENL